MQPMHCRGLAWDDDTRRTSYMHRLRDYLSDEHGIDIDLFHDPEDFLGKFKSNTLSLDLLLVDLLFQDSSGQIDDKYGFHLIRQIHESAYGRNIPIFVITSHGDWLDLRKEGLQGNIRSLSKSTRMEWTAGEISNVLQATPDSRKVLLIASGEAAAGASAKVARMLNELDLQVVHADTRSGFFDNVERCGFCVAVCTPETRCATWSNRSHVQFHPPSEVLVQIGAAMAVHKEPRPVIVLQKWGRQAEDRAELPASVGDLSPITFTDDVNEGLALIKARLLELGAPIAV